MNLEKELLIKPIIMVKMIMSENKITVPGIIFFKWILTEPIRKAMDLEILKLKAKNFMIINNTSRSMITIRS
jgi:hypothetical protein